MKKQNKKLELFKKWFIHYQYIFGLTGYRITFAFCDIGNNLAQLATDHGLMIATASLSNNLPKNQRSNSNIKDHAKHEAIHLLLARFSYNAWGRFVTKPEMVETEEEVVNKLENLIT